MNRKRDHDGLVQLSGLRLRVAQADMADILNREAALRRNLEQLIESKKTQAIAPRESDEAALIAGADIRWHQWVDQRRAAINAELAQIRVQKETCRAKLMNAFGRDQAAQTLLSGLTKSAKKTQLRRQNYES